MHVSTQRVVKKNKNLLLGVGDSIIKVPAVGLSYTVDRLIRGAVAAAVAAERARTTASAADQKAKALVSGEPAAYLTLAE